MQVVQSFKYLGINVPLINGWNACYVSRLQAGWNSYYMFQNQLQPKGYGGSDFNHYT